MTFTKIKRSDREECAIKLREFANMVSRGDVAFATIYVMDWRGHVEELIMKTELDRAEKSA